MITIAVGVTRLFPEGVDKDLTLVTIPDADHFVQQDAPDVVTRTMVDWLKR